MCDVDRFKAINDRFGDGFGDKVLVRIAGVLRSFAKKNCMLVARHGGGATNEQAAQCAEDIRRGLRGQRSHQR
jgi:diguanylate cyclase (GGDEF)-like protein